MRRVRIGFVLLGCSIAAAGVAGACSSSKDAAGGASGNNDPDSGSFIDLDSGIGALSIAPSDTTVTINPADGTPDPIEFVVTGAPADDVTWHVSNPAVGRIDGNGVFYPSGKAGGVVEVTATVGNQSVTVRITVKIEYRQNGADESLNADPGPGGLGGVGGEGFGPAIPDDLVTLLGQEPTSDSALSFLYPYDKTVFPLGILPPLLQWAEGSHGTFDAVSIHLSAPPYYDYVGTFGRPGRLAAGDAFVRHPIPREVWEGATTTAAGGTLEVEVVLAAGGEVYGPLRQTYRIALAPITGKIYYQAYNTDLVQNYGETTVAGDRMGGATLSIDVGAEGPELVAGVSSDDSTGCRVCHSVSAYGDRMLVQHGEQYSRTSSYDLKNANTETAPYSDGVLAWSGIYPDGTIGLGNSVNVGGTGESNGTTGLYDLETGDAIPSPGLADFATEVGLPVFSPDGARVAFVLFAGPSTSDVGTADGRKLVAMTFDRATGAFSDPLKLWETSASDERPAWPTFLPSSGAVVFQRRWQGNNGEIFSTRYGARGELWWVDLATGQARALDRTNGLDENGTSYLPKGPGHEQDERLSYEPSISPVASGGYAWMVFVSRRRYGNVATMDPFHSDPRDYDLEANITTKKIWMAAIDLEPEPGSDPSHPAFYIPGQELHGVNSRPFFALDPCISDAGICSTGVDCCSGFCRDGYCVPPPDSCSQYDERCETAADCCESTARCVGGFCAQFLQ